MLSKTSSVCLLALLASFSVLVVDSAMAQDPEKGSEKPPEILDDDGRPVMTLRDFMRVKLKASNQILEGLAVEDMELVQSGAQTLSRMSVAEKWRMYNDAMYRQFSSEFQRNTKELQEAAKEGQLDAAALKWVATTMSCIECHRYVRHHLVVESSGN
ncbi:MAG: hypothetical protein KDA80_07015 [Planctomycetaceae bacterium]|nr:hypothetical protein [Planctomycetaceae bacterium]